MAAEPFPEIPDTIPKLSEFWYPSDYQLNWVKGRIATDRRKYLLASVFARRILPLFEQRYPYNLQVRTAIEVTEQYADGLATDAQKDAAVVNADRAWLQCLWRSGAEYAANAACKIAGTTYYTADHAAWAVIGAAEDVIRAALPNAIVEQARHHQLLSLAVELPDWDDNWRSASAVGLAEAIYVERAFDRLPILADALEESDCQHGWLLAALRDTRMTSWYRGMWFLDRLRGVV